MISTPTPQVTTASTGERRTGTSLRPWYTWWLTILAFPVAGEIAYLIAGRVDSVSPAVLGGLIAGAGIGAAQWALLRRRGVNPIWMLATAVGFAAGLTVGSAVASYRTDISSLAVMGVITGLAIGVAQGATFANTKRMLLWSVATAALYTLGWCATTLGGISVDKQFMVFGLYGAISSIVLQSTFIRMFVPAKTVPS
jgi:hypothetical protein